jgi:hypothetical protein
MFCVFNAHANSTFHLEDWPVHEDADTWLWGPLCCNKRVLQNPFKLPSLPEHDDFEDLELDSLSCGHLLAMALVKIIYYQKEKNMARNIKHCSTNNLK